MIDPDAVKRFTVPFEAGFSPQDDTGILPGDKEKLITQIDMALKNGTGIRLYT